MLVLGRKAGESIRIGDDIEITLVSVSGNRVRIGIEAPRSVRVLRGELEQHTSPALLLTQEGVRDGVALAERSVA